MTFLKANLNGQTAIRVDTNWASQTSIVQGFGEFCHPDMILREEELAVFLLAIATQSGAKASPEFEMVEESTPFKLDDIYDESIEKIAQDAYQRDYLMFGFKRWGK